MEYGSRQALRTLRTALQHFVNAGFATDDFTPQNGSLWEQLFVVPSNAVANSLRDFDKFEFRKVKQWKENTFM